MSSTPPEATTAPAERGPYDPRLLEYELTIRGLSWADLRRPPFHVSSVGLKSIRDGEAPARDPKSMAVLGRVVTLLDDFPVKQALARVTARPS